VEHSSGGASGLSRAVRGQFDLVILEIAPPGRSDFDVCRELREAGMPGPS
jgi:DNA-binding response OmpR family regulator